MSWTNFVFQHVFGFRGERLANYFDDLEIEKVIPKLLQHFYESAPCENVIWFTADEIKRLYSHPGAIHQLEAEQNLYGHIRCQSIKPIEEGQMLLILRNFSPQMTMSAVANEGTKSHVLLPVKNSKTHEPMAYILVVNTPSKSAGRHQLRLDKELTYLAKHVGFSLKHWETQKLTFMDDLTCLYNNKYMSLVIDSEISRSQRDGLKFSVLFMDVDFFKSVNDTKGHWIGSHLLVEIGKILQNCVRKSDYAFRYGGDEFVVVLPNTSAEGAQIAAERMRSIVEKTDFVIEGEHLKLTLSIGLATFPDHAKNHKEIIKMADEAMYCGKNKSRNIVFVAS